jgi:hypothetical protein
MQLKTIVKLIKVRKNSKEKLYFTSGCLSGSDTL